MSKAAVILVNWNGAEDVAGCLSAIRAQDFGIENIEVVLIDNESTDDSLAIVRREHPWVRVIEHGRNHYAAAINLGVRETSAPYVALLNVDTRAESSWLSALVRTLEENPTAGVVTSKIYQEPPTLFSVGMQELAGLTWAPIGTDETDQGQYDGEYELKFLSHCACLYRRACLEEVGPLDEDFMMYHEDVDMSIRVRASGWRLFVNTDSVLRHKVHGSTKQALHLFNYFTDRNRLFVIAKHYPTQFYRMFPTSRFFRYKYQDDANDSFQRDLRLMVTKWLAARDGAVGLQDEIACLIRITKEHLLDRIEQLQTALEVKTEGLLKAVVRLEMDRDALEKKVQALHDRMGR